MTKSTITREQAQKIIVAADEVITALAGTNEDVHPDDSKKMCELWDDLNDRYAPPVVVRELARMALAAMDSEPHTDGELSNLLWYSQEATCHSDPNYYCEFHRLATPGLIAGIIRELQERRKADREPVAWLLSGGGTKNVVCFDSGNAYADPLREVTPLYRHPQTAPEYPETLPCPVLLEPGMRFGKGVKTRLVLDAIQRRAEQYAELEAMTQEERAEHDANIEAFKAMLPQPVPVAYSDFESFWSSYIHPLAQDDELKGFAWDIWCAAMLAAAPQSPGSEPATVPGKWIPVCERMPLTHSADCEYSNIEVNVFDGERVFTAHYATGSQPQPWGYWIDTYAKITHWQPLPAAPQEDKP